MARSQISGEFNTFVQGIITESTPLNYPENASLDEENFVLSRDGSRQRRLGVDYESGFTYQGSSVLSLYLNTTDVRVTTYRWDNVNNNPAVSLGVVCTNNTLYFYDLYASSPSSSLKDSTILAYSPVKDVPQFTTIGGKLIVVSGVWNSIDLISYDEGTETINITSLTPKVRDLWGIDERDLLSVKNNLPIEERPSTDYPTHRYNCYNQGWYTDQVLAIDTPAFTTLYDAQQLRSSIYPSNVDTWRSAQNAEGRFDSRLLSRFSSGNTPAAKGHYIISPFYRSNDREAESGLSVPSDMTFGGFTTVASFAGRVFYSGVRISSVSGDESTAPRLESAVLFTKTYNSDKDLTVCYPTQDPTDDEAAILATDGGILFIPEANTIYKLVAVGSRLLVFAENGIWSIQGSEESFSATNITVSKISNIGAMNSQAIVQAEGNIFYFSKSGIYQLGPDKTGLDYTVQNISETTIQTLYSDIPSVGRANATGSYDDAARKVTWLYNDGDDYNGEVNKYRYNKELILDLTLGAFSKYSFPADPTGPFIAGYMQTPSFLSNTITTDVVEGVDDVVEGTDDIVILDTVRSRGQSRTKYLTLQEGGLTVQMTFSELNNADYLDWYTNDTVGVDAAAFLETGYTTAKDSQRDKNIKYLITHFKRTEMGYELDGSGNIVLADPSSCLIQVRWDFSDSANSGRWSSQFQAYRFKRLYIPTDVNDPFDYGFDVITTKNKVRGKGKAFRLRFDTEPGKDFYLLGWGVTMSQSGDV